MKKVKVQKLSREAFHKFGSYSPLIDPFDEMAFGPKDAEIAFFPDLVQQDLNGAPASFSTCRVMPRPLRITDVESHTRTSETAIPLDGDVIVWFAPPSPDNTFPADKVEAFYVPQGYVVNCRPGVWHHAAFPVNKKPVNMLIVLPERTYANDAYCAALPAKEQIELVRK